MVLMAQGLNSITETYGQRIGFNGFVLMITQVDGIYVEGKLSI